MVADKSGGVKGLGATACPNGSLKKASPVRCLLIPDDYESRLRELPLIGRGTDISCNAGLSHHDGFQEFVHASMLTIFDPVLPGAL